MIILKVENRWVKWCLFPDLLKSYLINISIQLLFISIIFCDFGFAKIFHGMGMQMTNNGTGVYYKPGISLSPNSQIKGDIGFLLNTKVKSESMFSVENKNRSVFLNMSAGYQRELFKEMIVGVFRPVIILQGGGASDIDSFSWQHITGKWGIIYAAGVGFQFYNRRNLNEFMVKINRSVSTEWSMAFQLAIYWK